MEKPKRLGPHWLLVLIVFLLSLFVLPYKTSAQSQDEDSDFVVTLALMAVADDRMDGVMDLSALSNLRAEVDDYYTQKSYQKMDADTQAALNHQKQVVLSALDNKIDFQNTLSYRAQLALFSAMIDGNDYSGSRDSNSNPLDLYNKVISTGHTPDPEAVAMLQQRLAASTSSALQHDLNANLAANVDQGAEMVSLSSSSVYDFESGKDTSVEVQYRPLNFVNTGARTVRVSIEYYEPIQGLKISAPSLDVELPGDTNVILDGFPQGNYVFCFDWQTDLDTNGDGVKDYDRAVVHAWISPGHSQDPGYAHDVFVNAGFSETPTGRCGGFKGEAPNTEMAMSEETMTEDDPGQVVVDPTEDIDAPTDDYPNDDSSGDGGNSPGADFWDQGDGSDDSSSGTSLTSAEQANEGGHAYSTVCYEKGEMSETTYFHSSWSFSSEGVTLDGTYFYARISANVYQNAAGTKITFGENGFYSDTTYSETSSEGVTETVRRTCTATIND
jgi:hypothetical protein